MPIPQAPTTGTPSPPPPKPAVVTATTTGARPPEEFQPIAAFLACIFPGLGHFYLGQRSRAICIAVGVLSLFFGGMLIGGIDVIDSKEDTIWFVGQALVGPLAFGVDHYHQNYLKVMGSVRDSMGNTVLDSMGKPRLSLRTANPGETRDVNGQAAPAPPGVLPPNSKSLGRMNELGTLFATIAGMLNLIVIIDAAFGVRQSALDSFSLGGSSRGGRA